MSSVASSTRFNDRQQNLLKASGKGDERAVFALIDESLWQSQTDQDALRQSLQRVAGRGNLKLAGFLLGKGAEVNATKESALLTESSALNQAAKSGHSKVVELLLKHGADTEWRDRSTGRTVLFTPVVRGFTDTVRMLLEKGALPGAKDKDGKTILTVLASEKSTKWMQDKNWEIIRLLVQYGGDLLEEKDKTRRTALSWAASTGKAELCEYLLSGKAGKKADISAYNSKQQAALHFASENNHEATVKILLEHGANPAARSDGRWTALHFAAQKGHAKVVKVLLEQGDKTPVNAQLSRGMTPLHWAALNGHQDVVELLLQHKRIRNGVVEYVVNLSLRDTDDRTPLLCAAEKDHTPIVKMLSPAMTAARLPPLEREACERFHATVVDFGDLNGKHMLVNKDRSVYDLLYGWDQQKNKPLVPTHLKDVRRSSKFRWIHLPANNIAWIEALLAKTFVEGGCRDIEDFKALEKCFNQEHRGPEAHAHFMRTWSNRYALAPQKVDESIHPPDATDGAPRDDGRGDDAPPAVTITGADASDPPPTPLSVQRGHHTSSQDEGPGSERKKRKKSKGEAIEERHGKPRKRRNGPPGDTPKRKPPDRNPPSGPLSKAVDTHSGQGKIVLFMPYLHYESDTRRQRMAFAIERSRRRLGSDQLPRDMCPDDVLLQAYLKHDPPLHVRRTLDQFSYHSIDTSERDVDQVVYRHFKRNLKRREPMIFMVDQLWMWILGKELIVTCFPQRWDLPQVEDPLSVVNGITEELNPKSGARVESVYELAMIIGGRCCGVFDRHRLESEIYQFLDMFEIAIGKITDRETQLFNDFRRASAAMHFADETSKSRRYPQGRLSERAQERQFLTDISVETLLLAEIKDIQDELGILNNVLQNQHNVVPRIADNIIRELGGKKSMEATEIERKQKEQLRILQVHMKDLERMEKQTQSIYTSLTHLLDLKQKHANAFEARFASELALSTARSGQTILVFTIVTIFFLPMSFIAAFFAINVHNFADMDGGRGLSLGYISKYIFGIGLGISVPMIVIALSYDKVQRWQERWRRRREERDRGADGRQLSDLENKVQALLDRPRASRASGVTSGYEDRGGGYGYRDGRGDDGDGDDREYYAAELKESRHLTWEKLEEKAGLRPRTRRESRASHGSHGWRRPRISFEDRLRPGSRDLERGVGEGNGSVH